MLHFPVRPLQTGSGVVHLRKYRTDCTEINTVAPEHVKMLSCAQHGDSPRPPVRGLKVRILFCHGHKNVFYSQTTRRNSVPCVDVELCYPCARVHGIERGGVRPIRKIQIRKKFAKFKYV